MGRGRTAVAIGALSAALLLALVGVARAGFFAGSAPNDPAWRFQWALKRTHTPEVWRYTTGDPRVVIGVVDTGVLQGVPDMQGKFLAGWDFTDQDAVLDDKDGHGTMVTSQLIAQGNNGIDIPGYCWDCRVLPVRVTVGRGADVTQLALGIRWAADNGARIINVSFSIGNDAPVLRSAVNYALSKDILVVAGAGNGHGYFVSYPAAYPGVLGVAGTDEKDDLYYWSTAAQWVPLAAPGEHEVTWGETGVLQGTSVAGPSVAGIAALLLSLDPSRSTAQIADALKKTAIPVSGIGGGRVDAFAAAKYLGLPPLPQNPPGGGTPPPPPPPPPPGGGTPPPPSERIERRDRDVQLRTGTMRAVQSFPIRVWHGRVDLVLDVEAASRCSLSLQSLDETFISTDSSRRTVRLGTGSEGVLGGRYDVTIRCSAPPKPKVKRAVATRKPLGRAAPAKRKAKRIPSPIGKPYSLTIVAPFQTGR